MKKITNLLIDFYKYVPSFLSKYYEKTICRLDGGEPYSIIIRAIWYKYFNVKFGVGTYGILENRKFNFIGQGASKIEIGNYCCLARGVSRYSANHPYEWASMSPIFYEKSFGFYDIQLERTNLYIGNDVWIASDVSLLKGCTRIGNGAVIGCGSVVNCDVGAYEIWGGIPAKFIKMRFDNEQIDALESSKWWELQPKQIAILGKYIANPVEFAFRVQNVKSKN